MPPASASLPQRSGTYSQTGGSAPKAVVCVLEKCLHMNVKFVYTYAHKRSQEHYSVCICRCIVDRFIPLDGCILRIADVFGWTLERMRTIKLERSSGFCAYYEFTSKTSRVRHKNDETTK